MKALPILIILSVMLSLVGCGKGNESGKGGSRAHSNSYCVSYSPNGVCSQYQNFGGGNFSMNGVSLAQVQAENPCVMNMGGNMARQQISTPVNIGSVVANGDMYVGVTSFGDVAAIIGNGTPNPTFVAFLCPRPIGGQGTLYPQITIGAYTNCQVKYITSANMVFPDGSQANFRAPHPGGSSAGRPFTFCM